MTAEGVLTLNVMSRMTMARRDSIAISKGFWLKKKKSKTGWLWTFIGEFMHIFIWIFIVWMFGRIHVRASPGEVSYIEFRSRSSIRFEVLLIRMAIEYEDGQIMEICKTLSKGIGFYSPYLHKMINSTWPVDTQRLWGLVWKVLMSVYINTCTLGIYSFSKGFTFTMPTK